MRLPCGAGLRRAVQQGKALLRRLQPVPPEWHWAGRAPDVASAGMATRCRSSSSIAWTVQALIGSFGLVTLNSTSTTDSFVSFEQKYAISAPKATACNTQHARHRRSTVSPLSAHRNLLRNHLGESRAPVRNHLSRSVRRARERLLGLRGERSRSMVCLNRSDVALLVLAQHEERQLGALRPDGLHSIACEYSEYPCE